MDLVIIRTIILGYHVCLPVEIEHNELPASRHDRRKLVRNRNKLFMPSTVVCTGKVTFKKQSGTLQLTDSHITWTQDGKVSPFLTIPATDAACLFHFYAPGQNTRFTMSFQLFFAAKSGLRRSR